MPRIINFTRKFSRAIRRLKSSNLLGNFNYNEQTKRVDSGFKLNQAKTLHIQAPTYLLKVGVLTNNALAVLGYLKAMPKGEWDGLVCKLHNKMNDWFVKHKINLSLSLTSVYKAFKILKKLKLIDKFETKLFKNKQWAWNIKIIVNQKNINRQIEIKEIIQILHQITIKPFMTLAEKLKQQEIWNIFD